METKRCPKCGEEKLLEEYGKSSARKNGLQVYCKACKKKEGEEYRKNNPEKRKETLQRYLNSNREAHNKRGREWCRDNPEKRKEIQQRYLNKNREKIRERNRQWAKNNSDKIADKNLRYKKNNHIADVTIRLRSRLATCFKRWSKTGKCGSSKKCGIDFRAICEYLGPCPGNRNEYHIDHIRPLCSFDFDDLEQIKQAFAPENHQWLTAEENLKKGKKHYG